jgi:hypothetical protein
MIVLFLPPRRLPKPLKRYSLAAAADSVHVSDIISHDLSGQTNGASFAPPRAFSVRWWHLVVLKVGIAYSLLSIVTLPLVGSVWLGEIPLLASIQVPKLFVADWFRSDVVMRAIKVLGFSKGSFSPDYIMARPYGLGLAYSVPLILVSLSLLIPACASRRHRRLALIFFAVLIVDGFCTYFFARQRSLTLY